MYIRYCAGCRPVVFLLVRKVHNRLPALAAAVVGVLPGCGMLTEERDEMLQLDY